MDPTGNGDLISWLVSRQTNELEEPEDNGESDDENDMKESPEQQTSTKDDLAPLDDRISSLPDLQPASSWPPDLLECAGFNGRPNKIADTCYCFWVMGSLAVNRCQCP